MLSRRASVPAISFSFNAEDNTKDELWKVKAVGQRRSSFCDWGMKVIEDASPLGRPQSRELPERTASKSKVAQSLNVAGQDDNGRVVLDEEEALVQGRVEEERARIALDNAMSTGDSKVLQEAIFRARAAGVDNAKLQKAEGILKQRRSSEMRTQMQADFAGKSASRNKPKIMWEPQIFSEPIARNRSKGTVHEPPSPTYLTRCKSATNTVSPEAQAAIVGMMEAWVPEAEKKAWLKNSITRVRRNSISEMRKELTTLTH